MKYTYVFSVTLVVRPGCGQVTPPRHTSPFLPPDKGCFLNRFCRSMLMPAVTRTPFTHIHHTFKGKHILSTSAMIYKYLHGFATDGGSYAPINCRWISPIYNLNRMYTKRSKMVVTSLSPIKNPTNSLLSTHAGSPPHPHQASTPVTLIVSSTIRIHGARHGAASPEAPTPFESRKQKPAPAPCVTSQVFVSN
jgi:hypothetical protein